ncbi:MAG: hypothetical protein JXR25_03360 [Pontiellaceae bacterium]|nr:hypothetical protein [Pontiellaceae bacterium]MBN2783841.1 hypothetical protein [Pontiellaceae bacterium]
MMKHGTRACCAFSLSLFTLAGLTPVTQANPADARPSVVKLSGDAASGYKLLRNGEPYVIRGVGGERYLDVLAGVGGNTIRTWGIGEHTGELLDTAYENGISVTVGIWLGHERHGFDYNSQNDLKKQREAVVEAVKKYRNHPALLSWGLGNEMEGPTSEGSSPIIWKEINVLAEAIKKLDPNHPVMTVVANINPAKVKAVQTYAPSVDILGVNAYAGAGGIGNNLIALGWDKPYCITEFGLPGPWEVSHTDWNAPIEPSSREKAGYYYVAQKQIMEEERQCLGSYAFLWGSKQEATASWFGMLLPSGEKTITVDSMGRAWTGHWPGNRAPLLKEVNVPFALKRVPARQKFDISVVYSDPDGDPLEYLWEIYEESTDRQTGGDKEQKPEAVASCILKTGPNGTATINTPSKKGAYRLFVTVRDGKNSAAIDNWPFYVE